MHERAPRIVRHKIDRNGVKRHDICHVLEQPTHLNLAYPCDFECVSVLVTH
jgi:hypothetical protein